MMTDGGDAPLLHDVRTPVSSIWGYGSGGSQVPDALRRPGANTSSLRVRTTSPKEPETIPSSLPSFDRTHPSKRFKGNSSYTRRVVENGIAFRFGMRRDPGLQ